MYPGLLRSSIVLLLHGINGMNENERKFQIARNDLERCLVIIIIRDVHCPCKVYGPSDAQNQNLSSGGWIQTVPNKTSEYPKIASTWGRKIKG